MEKNNLLFFQQATKLICGSLDIDITLKNCFEFLKKYMPVDGMAMNIYDRETRTVKNIASACDPGDQIMEKLNSFKLSREAADFIENMPAKVEPAQIINHPEQQVIANLAWEYIGKSEISILIMHPVIGDVRFGVVYLYSKGFNRYEPEHSRLLTLLHDPFAIAFANTLKHQEIVGLKEMLADDNFYLNKQLLSISGDEIIGKNQGLKNVMDQVGQVAKLSSHVLLLGETGVGKEVIANSIHYSSTRAEGPFIKVNCGAIPENLIDSELFGYEKGAFTGALHRYRGRFERADKGTIFLDEIGDLPLSAQVKLLRVIQHREVERVGGSKPVFVDIRIIAATHRNLEEMVKKGDFREDLWFRLNVFPIMIPPLRHRFSDIPELVNYFILKKSREMNLKSPPVPEPGFFEKLCDYKWPGNVRELENVVERALIKNFSQPHKKPLFFDISGESLKEETIFAKPSSSDNIDYNLDNLIKNHILEVLQKTKGKIKGKGGAAEYLGVNPSTLRNKMNRLQIPYGRNINYN